MIKKIIAIVLSVAVVIGAVIIGLDFPELKLKSELAKGNYESPYIVRPLETITVNGVSVDECAVSCPEGELFANAAEALGDEIYKVSGKKLADNGSDVFVIEEDLYDDDTFTVRVADGKVYVKGSKNAGISRGIAAFCDEVLLSADGSFDFKDGYEYKKTFQDFVTYEQFGAVGDGKADDFDAVIRAHEYANENGKSVFASETATYYIGGADKTAVIKTDTSWSTARFVIDDTDVENRGAWIFAVSPSEDSVDITENVAPMKMDAANIGTKLEKKSLVVLTDSDVKRYIRKGANQNSGSNQTDVILVDENGNISAETPLIWDFDAITSATAYPVDSEVLTIKGGRFTTIANAAPSEYTYYSRGISVRRSNTVIDGLRHYIENEGKTGAPYSAFISLSHCADVTVKNCTMTGHKKYATIGSAGTKVQMGTYDLGAATSVNSSFINCNQTNDITDIDYWGIAGTNYCKNLVYDGCALSRYDAHQGVLNATVINSVLGHHGIKLIGMGTALIENTTVLSGSFVDLRADYGSTWNGELIIRNCEFYPTNMQGHIVNAENSEDHDFGYTCHLPDSVEIDGLYMHRLGSCYVFSKVNPGHNSEEYEAKNPVVTPNKVTVKDFDNIIFGKLRVSKNKAMFDVEITQ